MTRPLLALSLIAAPLLLASALPGELPWRSAGEASGTSVTATVNGTEHAEVALEWVVQGEAVDDAPLPIDLFLVNVSDEGLWALPTLDGSSRRMRFPYVQIEVTDAAGEPVSMSYAGCGNSNTLQDADFVWLEPGERLQLDAQWTLPPLVWFEPKLPAGDYSLVATYDATPSAPGLGRGFGDGGWKSSSARLHKLLSLPRGEVRSEPLQLTVKPGTTRETKETAVP